MLLIYINGGHFGSVRSLHQCHILHADNNITIMRDVYRVFINITWSHSSVINNGRGFAQLEIKSSTWTKDRWFLNSSSTGKRSSTTLSTYYPSDLPQDGVILRKISESRLKTSWPLGMNLRTNGLQYICLTRLLEPKKPRPWLTTEQWAHNVNEDPINITYDCNVVTCMWNLALMKATGLKRLPFI